MMHSFLALGIFVAAFVMIATEKINKVLIVLVASAAMIITGVSPGNEVFYSHEVGIDWDVIFLLMGMMIIVGVLKQTGVFEFLGVWAAKKSQGHPYRLMVMLMLITAIASPILDNVTIIMLVVPVTIVVCNRLHIPAQPYIIAEILASNIGGAATLIGDPPNIIIANRAGLSFNDFLIHMAPIVAVTFVLFVLLTRVMFRKEFQYNPEHVESVMALQERRAITDGPLLVKSLIVLTGVIIGFTLHTVLHMAPSIIALIGALVMILVTGIDIGEVITEVEWPTLVFFAGLFIMVGGWCIPGSSRRSGSGRSPRSGMTTHSRQRPCCSARRRWGHSSTTSRMRRPWRRSWMCWSPTVATPTTEPSCGGRSRWVPTSAATEQRWRPAQTSSASGWRLARDTRSRSGISPSTAY